jgi:hypothetical protein
LLLSARNMTVPLPLPEDPDSIESQA